MSAFRVYPLFFLLLLSGCAAFEKMAGISQSEGHGYEIEHIEKSYLVTITYKHYDHLMDEAAKEARLTMREPEEPSSKGGYIVVHLEEQSLEAARASNFEMVVMRDGEEVRRSTGSTRTPSVPTGNNFWSSTSIVLLSEPLESGYIDLYVTNKPAQKRDHFRIHAKE